MGRRKRRSGWKKKPKKKVEKLATVFNCPFCSHEKCVECSFSHERTLGALRCTMCNVKFEMSITHLDEAVDVYASWIDACDENMRAEEAKKGKAVAHEREDAIAHGDRHAQVQVQEDKDYDYEEERATAHKRKREKSKKLQKKKKVSMFDSDYEVDEGYSEDEDDDPRPQKRGVKRERINLVELLGGDVDDDDE